MVANHTAWDSVMMAHPEFYKHDASGNIIPPVPEWTDVAGLNYENPKLREYMLAMLKHWVDPATFDSTGSVVMWPRWCPLRFGKRPGRS